MSVELARIESELLRPFPSSIIKFRAASKPNAKGNVRCLTYIDARIAAERIRSVDPSYQFRFEILATHNEFYPVKGILTIGGITREDIGQCADDRLTDMYAKDGVSDAFKRAAVQFGVGSYLYALGDCWMNKGDYGESNGKVSYIKDDGMRKLRAWYDKTISTSAFIERFGTPLEQGVILTTPVEPTETVSKPLQSTKTTTALSDDHVAEITRLTNLVNGDVKKVIEWSQAKIDDGTPVVDILKKLKDQANKKAGEIAQDNLVAAFDAKLVPSEA